MPTRGYQTGGRASHYDPSLSPTHATGLWRTCPLLEYAFDQSIGVYLSESWVGYNPAATNGDYVGTAATAGSAAISTTVPGALTLDSGDTTAHHGYQVQRLKSAFVPAANKSIWAEFTVQAAFLTIETFIGLAASDTTIIASGAMTTNNRIGWTSVTGDGVLLFDTDKAGTGATSTGTTLVAATNVRLGFYYDGAADTVQQFINGAATGTAVATAKIPKLVIYPSLVCQNSSTDEATLTVSAYRIFQLR